MIHPTAADSIDPRMCCRCHEKSDLYRSREELFGFALTTYPQLTEMQQLFDPYNLLWRMCGEFLQMVPDWRDGPFPNINASQVVSDCDRCAPQSAACAHQFGLERAEAFSLFLSSAGGGRHRPSS